MSSSLEPGAEEAKSRSDGRGTDFERERERELRDGVGESIGFGEGALGGSEASSSSGGGGGGSFEEEATVGTRLVGDLRGVFRGVLARGLAGVFRGVGLALGRVCGALDMCLEGGYM